MLLDFHAASEKTNVFDVVNPLLDRGWVMSLNVALNGQRIDHTCYHFATELPETAWHDAAWRWFSIS
jgi:hypothetical protein